MANEFTRITHKSNGVSLVNINPNKSVANPASNPSFSLEVYASTGANRYFGLPVCGYKKIAFCFRSDISFVPTLNFIDANGNEINNSYASIATTGNFTDYYDIPDGAITAQIKVTGDGRDFFIYSLLTQ